MAYLVLLLGHTHMHSLIISCSQLTHNNQRIIIFGNLHVSEPGGKRTLKQRNDLVTWLRSLQNSKLVIVEDKASRFYKDAIIAFMLKNTKDHDNSCIVDSLYFLFNICEFYDIPVINCEWRNIPNFVEKYVQALETYDDGPILNDWYAHMINDTYKDEEHGDLIQAYTAHAIYNASSQDIVVLVSEYHRQVLTQVLQTVNYKLLQEIEPPISLIPFMEQDLTQQYNDYLKNNTWNIAHWLRNLFDQQYPQAIGRQIGLKMAQEYGILYALDCSFVIKYWLQGEQ